MGCFESSLNVLSGLCIAEMNCDICQRAHHAQKRPFLCAVDARNRCYEGRIRNLQVIIEGETLQKQINTLVSEAPSSPRQRAKQSMESLRSQRIEVEDRTSQLVEEAGRIKQEVAAARIEIESVKENIARRRSDLASASNGIDGRRDAHEQSVDLSIQRGKVKLESVSDRLSSTRSFLCMEAAKLYGLRRIKKGGGPGRYEYRLGGIDIIDLSSMNSTFCPAENLC